MEFVPHEYQKYAIKYIEDHPVAAVLLDMGLGKTAITLTALNDLMFDSFEVSKALVIAPLRVAANTWPQEIEKWTHLKGLRYSVVVGTEKARRAALEKKADVYIINRENVPWLVANYPFNFDMVIVDELSSFKNWNSKRFKSLMRVRPRVRRVVGLTGTPAPNGYMDLFAEYKLLDKGERLGRFISGYRYNYFTPDWYNGPTVYSYKLRPGAAEEIYHRVSDITISMKAEDHLEMPEFVSTEYAVSLDEEERSLYDKMKKELILSLPDGEITAANAAVLSGKLTQLANGAIYDEDGTYVEIHSRKLDALEDIIESMNGNPMLVAYWYKHDLERIEERLTEKGIEFERLDSSESIRRWNAGKIPVALVHPASTGHGLNLQSGGSTIVWFGLQWSLELYQQLNARLYRQGQRDKTVVALHIVAADTIDEEIMAALKAKDKTQAALIDAVKANLNKEVTK